MRAPVVAVLLRVRGHELSAADYRGCD